MFKEITKIINMSDYVKADTTHVELLCKHGRTMIMMYQATGEVRYLKQARIDLQRAKSIKVGFIRPFGAILNNAA